MSDPVQSSTFVSVGLSLSFHVRRKVPHAECTDRHELLPIFVEDVDLLSFVCRGLYRDTELLRLIA